MSPRGLLRGVDHRPPGFPGSCPTPNHTGGPRREDVVLEVTRYRGPARYSGPVRYHPTGVLASVTQETVHSVPTTGAGVSRPSRPWTEGTEGSCCDRHRRGDLPRDRSRGDPEPHHFPPRRREFRRNVVPGASRPRVLVHPYFRFYSFLYKCRSRVPKGYDEVGPVTPTDVLPDYQIPKTMLWMSTRN